jgi:hypothetical protein
MVLESVLPLMIAILNILEYLLLIIIIIIIMFQEVLIYLQILN